MSSAPHAVLLPRSLLCGFELFYQIIGSKICKSRLPLAQRFSLPSRMKCPDPWGEHCPLDRMLPGRCIAGMACAELPVDPKSRPPHCRRALAWECAGGEGGTSVSGRQWSLGLQLEKCCIFVFVYFRFSEKQK